MTGEAQAATPSRTGRWAVVIGVALLAVFVVATVVNAQRGELEDGWRSLAVGAAFLVALTMAVVGAGYGLARVVRPGRTGRPRWLLVGWLAVTAGLAAAAPVTLTWDDGCNAHGGLVPLVFAPLTAITAPERPMGYMDSSTLMGCFEKSGRSNATRTR